MPSEEQRDHAETRRRLEEQRGSELLLMLIRSGDKKHTIYPEDVANILCRSSSPNEGGKFVRIGRFDPESSGFWKW